MCCRVYDKRVKRSRLGAEPIPRVVHRKEHSKVFEICGSSVSLRRPYTIAVLCLLILVMGILSLSRMIVDIFPAIDIPVVMVVRNYPGLSAEQMERRAAIIGERTYSSTVNGIERIESQSIPGLLRVYFQPGTEVGPL